MNNLVQGAISFLLMLTLIGSPVAGQDTSHPDKLQRDADSLRVLSDSLRSELDRVNAELELVEQDIVAAKVDLRSSDGPRMLVKTRRPASIFDGPSASAEQVGRIPSDEEALYLGRERNRFHVHYQGVSGYISVTAAQLNETTKDYLAARERQAAEEEEARRRWVNQIYVSIYEGPGEDYPFQTMVSKGRPLKLIGEQGDWSEVEGIPFEIEGALYGRETWVGWIESSALSMDPVPQATMEELQAHTRQQRQRAAQERRRIADQRRQAFVENNPDLSSEMRELVLEGKIRLGMRADLVRASWGEPRDINRTVTSSIIREQWVYGSTGNRTYIYIRNGTVTSFQD